MENAPIENRAKAEGAPRDYAPSWLDRFHSWLAQLPGPSWLYYPGIWLVLVLLQIAVLWGEGAYPAGSFPVNHIFIAGLSPFLLALSQVLDIRADAALATLRPVMKASDEDYGRLRYQLIMLPVRPALLASLAAVTSVVLLNLVTDSVRDFGGLGAFPISRTVIYLTYLGAWWVVAGFLYHTVHQLKTIHLIYTQHTRINLFNMRPLYGLSGVTALTGASLTIVTYGWIAINPDLLGNAISMAIVLPITALALATFLWPLLGVHRLLEEEKGQLLDECSRRIESAIALLHQRVDGEQLGGMDDLNKTIASLEIEHNLLDRIPTWPWQPETVRLLITALALPLGLWLIQYVLQRVIGP